MIQVLLYNCQQDRKKKGHQKMTKKERLVRLSVRVSPKAVETLEYLQDYTGESLSNILREVIDEGLKVEKEKIGY